MVAVDAGPVPSGRDRRLTNGADRTGTPSGSDLPALAWARLDDEPGDLMRLDHLLLRAGLGAALVLGLLTAPAAGTTTAATAVAEPDPATAALIDDGGLVPLTPVDVYSTRTPSWDPLPAQGTRSVQVVGVGGVPAQGVAAVVLTVTAHAPMTEGYLTVYPDGSPRPATSSLNLHRGTYWDLAVTNQVLVPVGGSGRVTVFNGSSGQLDVEIATAAYVVDGSDLTPGAVVPVAPSRVLDTRRTGEGITAGTTLAVPVAGVAGVPRTGASAVVVNLTAVAPTRTGWITAHADRTPRPEVSNLNLNPGLTQSNLAVVPIGRNGRIALYNGSSAPAHTLADVVGYVVAGAPSAPGSYVPLPAPTRVLDTRQSGPVPLQGGVHVRVPPPPGRAASDVGSVVLTITPVTPAAYGWLVARPRGSTPTEETATLRYVQHTTRPSTVVVETDGDGWVTLVNGSWSATHLVVDVAGFVLPGWGAGSFAPTPVRGRPADSLSCSSGTSCVATAGTEVLTSRGDAWSRSPAPRPAGTTGGSLRDVDCGGGTCAALGSWAGADGTSGAYVATRASGSWSTARLVQPAGASTATPTDVRCAADGACTLVGSHVRERQRPVAARASTGWTLEEVPVPTDVTGAAQLDAVACVSAGSCTATGSYRTAAGVRLLVSTLADGAWSSEALDLPAGGHLRTPTTRVACADATTCALSVEWRDASHVTHGFLLARGGTGTWTSGEVISSVMVEPMWADLDCVAAGPCLAVGSFRPTLQEAQPLARQLVDGSWTPVTVPTPGGGNGYLAAVDCLSADVCVAAGRGHNSPDFLASSRDGVWSSVRTAYDGVRYTSVPADVACATPGPCTALARGAYRGAPDWEWVEASVMMR